MIAHFDFFRFYNLQIIVACDAEDEVLGYCCVNNGDELCQVFVYPQYRGLGVVHQLVWKAIEFVREIGRDYLWGTALPNVKDIYIGYVERWGAKLVEETQAEDRIDGKWKGVFDISQITPDRRPELRR